MKLLQSLTFFSIPLLSLANPITSPNESVLEARADKWCTLHSSVNYDVNCRKGAGTGYAIVRKIHPSDRFGVRCKANGESVEGNKVWDWIPGWGCWVSAHYTNDGCESMFPDASRLRIVLKSCFRWRRLVLSGGNVRCPYNFEMTGTWRVETELRGREVVCSRISLKGTS